MSTTTASRVGPILEVKDLSIHFRSFEGWVFVLDRARLEIPTGAVMGVVGESGCGKSTLARLLLGLIPSDTGEIEFERREVDWSNRVARRLLRRIMLMVF